MTGLTGLLVPRKWRSMRREHWLQRFVQSRAIFLGHRNEFNGHTASRRDPSHHCSCSHFPELEVHQYLHHAAERHGLARNHEQSAQPNTLQIRDGPPRARLPRNPQTLRRHDARIAPLFCIPHGDFPKLGQSHRVFAKSAAASSTFCLGTGVLRQARDFTSSAPLRFPFVHTNVIDQHGLRKFRRVIR